MTKTNTTENYAGDWCRQRDTCCARQRGSDSRYQMKLYAVAVAVALHGAAVCHCGQPVSITSGEVDRTAAGCYRPGYVIMTCEACNNDRTNVPEFNTVEYAADVLRASLGIPIMRKSEARREWLRVTDKGASVRRSKYYKK